MVRNVVTLHYRSSPGSLDGAAKQAPTGCKEGRFEVQRRLNCKPKKAGWQAKGARTLSTRGGCCCTPACPLGGNGKWGSGRKFLLVVGGVDEFFVFGTDVEEVLQHSPDKGGQRESLVEECRGAQTRGDGDEQGQEKQEHKEPPEGGEFRV